MNIKEAKDEIARSVEIYLDKNEFGEYNIPYMKQRPIFMIGAPDRQDRDYGADRVRAWHCTGFLFYDTSYQTECDRSAIDRGETI